MQVTLPVKTPFKKQSDKEIFTGIREIKDKNDRSLLEFEFYNRFAPYIWKVASMKCRHFRDPEFLSREILQETFIKAFVAIIKFDFPEEATDLECKHIIKAWLGRIANNEFMKAKDKYSHEESEEGNLDLQEPSFNLFNDLYDEPVDEIPNDFKLKLQEAMNKLEEKDKDIIMTFAREGCIGSTQHLSDQGIKYLTETYKTTPENIRQRKKRALDKIKSICFSPTNLSK